MKKYLFFILSFISMFFVFSSDIGAKSVISNDIKVSFGEEKLNLEYAALNSYKILSDNSFYYDGDKYEISSDYESINGNIDIVNGKFQIGEESFNVDYINKRIIGSDYHETYSLPIKLEFLKENITIYSFKQELCYKYGEIEGCNVDVDDISEVSSFFEGAYFYDFLPFYNKDLRFDYLTYKFTLTNGNNVINFDPIRFDKDDIIYSDAFNLKRNSKASNYDQKQYIFISKDNNKLYTNVKLEGNGLFSNSSYNIKIYAYSGQSYDEKNIVYSSSNFSISSYTTTNLDITSALGYSEGIIKNKTLRFAIEYSCKSNCNDSRNVIDALKVSDIYHLNEGVPTFSGAINFDKLINDEYLGANKIVTNDITFNDDNGILSIYYLLTNKPINDYRLINNKVIDNKITIGEELDGFYYLYIRVFDGSGSHATNLNTPYIYLFDTKGPNIKEGTTNFNDYNIDTIYSNISLVSGTYEDDYFPSSFPLKVLFKVYKENEVISDDDIINTNNEYSGSVNMRNYINSNGKYTVCFIGMDYLNNYGNRTCSPYYSFDVEGLRKEEVSITSGNSSYVTSLPIRININGVNEGFSFKCGLISVSDNILSEEELTNTCFNNMENNISYAGEGEFNLYIYAPDYLGNYALVKFDEVYLLDNRASFVNYNIVGNNKMYSSDVKINVDVTDLNGVNLESLKYMFYQNNYNENDFLNLDLNQGINYPLDYYGIYKLAINACDNLGNCKVNTFDDNFYIDTGKITINLIGKETIYLLRWGNYKELGAIVTKGESGKVIADISYKIEGDIDTSKDGVYHLHYIAGEGVNRVSITRTIVVNNSVPYIIVFITLFSVVEVIILLRLFVKKKKNDSI